MIVTNLENNLAVWTLNLMGLDPTAQNQGYMEFFF